MKKPVLFTKNFWCLLVCVMFGPFMFGFLSTGVLSATYGASIAGLSLVAIWVGMEYRILRDRYLIVVRVLADERKQRKE